MTFRDSGADIASPNPLAVQVACAAFRGMQRGAATGDWSGFTDLMLPEVKIMIPVPPQATETPEGLIVGKTAATAALDRHHHAHVVQVSLEGKRIAANGSIVMIEARVEGQLAGEQVANHYVFTFDVRDGGIASMYHYAIWNAKRPGSGWNHIDFAREAFETKTIAAEKTLFDNAVGRNPRRKSQ